MSVSEVSQLFEKIRSDLLSDDGIYTLKIIDTVSGQSLLEEQVPIENPFDFDLSRFLPNHKFMDLPRFIEVADQLISTLQDNEGIIEEKKVKLVSDFQPERFNEYNGTVITYKVMKRHPANMDKKATGRPQRRASHAYDLRSADNPNKVVVVESRPIDHVIQFAIWSNNAEHANRLALWLENNLIIHTWAFQVQGAERFFWQGARCSALESGP